MRTLTLLLGALAIGSGCADGQSFLHVTVSGEVAAEIDHFDVRVTNQSQTAKVTYRPTTPTGLPFDFALTFDANERGTVLVSVDAWSASALLGSGAMTADLRPSHGTTLSIALTPDGLDGGAGSDLAQPNGAPDLAGIDLAGVDLAGVDLAMPPILGDATIEPYVDTHSAGLADAGNFIAGASGTVNSLSVYYDAGNATELLIGLYDDLSGHPHALLTQATVTSPTAGAWNSATAAPVAVTSGTTYWIALLTTPGHGTSFAFRYGSGGGAGNSTEHSSLSNLTALPAYWSTGTTYPGTYCSFYASP